MLHKTWKCEILIRKIQSYNKDWVSEKWLWLGEFTVQILSGIWTILKHSCHSFPHPPLLSRKGQINRSWSLYSWMWSLFCKNYIYQLKLNTLLNLFLSFMKAIGLWLHCTLSMTNTSFYCRIWLDFSRFGKPCLVWYHCVLSI